MEAKRFKPKIDKLFFFIWVPTLVLMAAATVVAAFDAYAIWILIFTDIFVLYFLISPFFGCVELRESTLFIRFGFIVKKEIPYGKIRGLVKERKFYSYSMLSLKNAFEHVNIKYNTFDTVTVSVRDNDEFIKELTLRIGR